MRGALGATKSRWVITRQPVAGDDSVVVIYTDVSSGQRIPLCSFPATATDESVIEWIVESGRICVADEIITSAGDVLVWLPIGMRLRTLRLDGRMLDLRRTAEA